MRQPKKTRKLDYRQRGNVEHEGYDGVHSDFYGELEGQNAGHLFKKILSRNNLNQAYLQVVKNKEGQQTLMV